MLLTVCAFFRTYVAMDDPQWLAQAFMMGGLAVIVRKDGVARISAGGIPIGKLAFSALLMLAGGFVKHNEVAVPLTVALWLAILNRRAAASWVGIACAGLVVAGLIVAALYGHDAFNDILHHQRIYRASLMKNAFFRLAPIMPMAAIVTLVLRQMWRSASDEARRETQSAIILVSLFIVIATVTGVLQRYGEGVYYNAHFETLGAVSLGFGLALSRSFEGAPQDQRRLAFSSAILAGVAALPILGWRALEHSCRMA